MDFIAVFKNGQKTRVKNCAEYDVVQPYNIPLVRVRRGENMSYINPAACLYWGREDHFEEVKPEPEKLHEEVQPAPETLYDLMLGDLLSLPNCNDCAMAPRNGCGFCPGIGEQVRFNCPLHVPKEADT